MKTETSTQISFLSYIEHSQKSGTVNVVYETVLNQKQMEQRYKALKATKRYLDIKPCTITLKSANNERIKLNESVIMPLYRRKCLDFARFMPEVISYIENNYKAKKGVYKRLSNNREKLIMPLTWIQEYGGDLDGNIDVKN